jgi:CO/xanthine dehydrogenase Mo-binding subunit
LPATVSAEKKAALAGAGETPIMAIARASGNAYFDATKVRLTSLPLQFGS